MVTNANDLVDIDLRTTSYEEIRKWFMSYGSMEYAEDENLKPVLSYSSSKASNEKQLKA